MTAANLVDLFLQLVEFLIDRSQEVLAGSTDCFRPDMFISAKSGSVLVPHLLTETGLQCFVQCGWHAFADF